MYFDIFFTFVLMYILYSISIEDIRTMLISEQKLILLGLSGFIYMFFIGLHNDNINSFELISNNLFSMIIVFIIMYAIGEISFNFLE